LGSIKTFILQKGEKDEKAMFDSFHGFTCGSPSWPLDVAPRVIDINSGPPPYFIYPEASATWDQQ
jgi:hypothetical protein